jgi:hydrogenase expression/formation protein HypE
MKKLKKFLPTGKLSHEFLIQLLENYTTISNNVVVGAKVGEDAAAIDIGDKYLLAKTDPITFVTDEIGYYAININANDIACMGGIPRWFLATLLLPENKTTKKMVENIFTQLHSACCELDIAFCGGHTEVTYGIDRPIVIGQMLGETFKDKLIISSKVQVGDDILLTKGIAIEATSIIAREKANELKEDFSQDLIERCKNFLHDPGISILKEAKIAMAFDKIHAMHDPTEGGLAVGLFELAKAAGVGLKVEYDLIDFLPESKLLCDIYELDPLGIIASGALLIVCDPAISPELLAKYEENNINASKIGRIQPPEHGLKMISYEGEELDLPYFPQDEIVKFFNNHKKEEKQHDIPNRMDSK